MRDNPAANTVRNLIDTIPDDRLRQLVVEISIAALRCLMADSDAPAAAAPAANGSPRRRHLTTARREAHNAARREKRKRGAQARGAKRHKPKATNEGKVSTSNGAGESTASNGQVSATALWKHATKLEPKAPWRAVVRELGVSDGAAQNAHRNETLPANISPAAVARFLTL
jgi:hypothetical protein